MKIMMKTRTLICSRRRNRNVYYFLKGFDNLSTRGCADIFLKTY